MRYLPALSRLSRLFRPFVVFLFVASLVPTIPFDRTAADNIVPRAQSPRDAQARKVDPLPSERGRPQLNIPNLDELRRQPPAKPKIAPPVPSTMRSPRKRLTEPQGPTSQTPAVADQKTDESLRKIQSSGGARRGFDRRASRLLHHANAAAAPAVPQNGSSYAERALARLDPFSQSGDQIKTRDCEWSLTLLSLPGRAGLDLSLTLSYSSQVWTRSGNTIYYDEDNGSPSPGFHLGFPTIEDVFFDAQKNVNARLLVTAAGQHVELRQVGTTNKYESADSSYLQLTDNGGGSLTLRTTDGTQMSYTHYLDDWRVTRIQDRNGNFLTIDNEWHGDLRSITDTLGRVIHFSNDQYGNLNSISQFWNGGWHTFATFGWVTKTFTPNFSGVSIAGAYQNIPVLAQVGLADGSTYTFGYDNNVGQVNMIQRWTDGSSLKQSQIAYDYESPISDCPRIFRSRAWAQNWSGYYGVPVELMTYFSVNTDGSHQTSVTGDPNGTVYKEIYGSGWRNGLLTRSEVWAGGNLQKTIDLQYQHDGSETAAFATNPRIKQTDISDASNNLRRTKMSYTSLGLLSDIYEFDGNGVTVLRRTHTDYKLADVYVDRRIIGLPWATYVCDGAGGENPCGSASGSSLQAMTTYEYDEAAVTDQGEPASHDAAYGAGFSSRGNLTSVRRYNVDNLFQSTVSTMQYNTAGLVISTHDPLGHGPSISYDDNFSDGNNNRHTFAYPTTVRDADGYSTFVQYNFDFGAQTRVQTPPPNTQDPNVYQRAGAILRL
jgi:hypothetical protein